MRARLTLLAILALLALSAAVCAQGDDIFSREAVARESQALEHLKPVDKAKIRRALSLLHNAIAVASVSRDSEEIAAASSRASGGVDAAEEVIPRGVLKGTLEACRKALGHYFILRLVNSGALDPEKPPTSAAMEDIVLRYELASVPKYERPARALEFARAQLLIADGMSARVGITQKKGRSR